VKETQMSNDNREIVHYLRNDLRIATTLARLKREQADQAALRVVELQRRLLEAESSPAERSVLSFKNEQTPEQVPVNFSS
jgi:hypothetical protein